jgi:hypothetical protein
MKNELGLALLYGASQPSAIADIALEPRHKVPDPGCLEQARRRRRRKRKPHDRRLQLAQPEGEPRAFEAGDARHENATATPERSAQSHTFHGALPVVHNVSRYCLSRR